MSGQAVEPFAVAVGDLSERTTLPMRAPTEARRDPVPLPFQMPRRRNDGEVGPGGTLKMESGGSLVSRARAQVSQGAVGALRAGARPASPKQAPQLHQKSTSAIAVKRGAPMSSTMTRQVLYTHPQPVSVPRTDVTPIVVRAGTIGAIVGLCCVAIAVGIVELRHGRHSTTVATSAPSLAAENPTGAPSVPAITLPSVGAAQPTSSSTPAAPFMSLPPAGPVVTSASVKVLPPPMASIAPMPKPPVSTRRSPPKPVFVPLVGDDDLPRRDPVAGKPLF